MRRRFWCHAHKRKLTKDDLPAVFQGAPAQAIGKPKNGASGLRRELPQGVI